MPMGENKILLLFVIPSNYQVYVELFLFFYVSPESEKLKDRSKAPLMQLC